MRLINYQDNSMEKTAPMSQFSPTGSLPQHRGIVETTIQDESWVRTQRNHITYVSYYHYKNYFIFLYPLYSEHSHEKEKYYFFITYKSDTMHIGTCKLL